jgi:hypothetical protein
MLEIFIKYQEKVFDCPDYFLEVLVMTIFISGIDM